jgi:hypothetical protein
MSGINNTAQAIAAALAQALAADTAALAQALAADISNFTGANQSLAQNGFQKLPGGLIVQWGVAATTATSDVVVGFAIPFPTACLVVLPVSRAAVGVAYFASVNSNTLASANLSVQSAAGGAGLGKAIDWVAIGY